VAAIVSGGSQLQFRAAKDPTCSLQILPQDLGGFDTAFAFRQNFTRDYPAWNFMDNISAKLLEWREKGELDVCLSIALYQNQ
jgi:hypothetical protein